MIKTVSKRSKTLMKRSETIRNGQKRWTLNDQERLGTFESERNNALERIVENVLSLPVRSRSRFKNERNTVR